MEYIAVVFVLFFVLLDLVTGTLAALTEHEWNSSVMRQGLMHKTGSLLCVAFGVLVEQASDFVDLGVNIPIFTAICTYICLMECGSIIENLGKINPEIVPDKIRQYFGKLNGKDV